MGGSAMGKLVAIFLLTGMLGAVANGSVIVMPGASSAKFQIPKPLHPAAKRISQDHGYQMGFYIHEVGTGPNKTVWNVAYSENTLTSPSSFGLIQMIDSPITGVPELDSLSGGRVQGTFAYADLHQTAVIVNLNIRFTVTEGGIHEGDSLHLLGRISLSGQWRDEMLSVVGGTGTFSGARGDAFSSYYSFDNSTLHRVSTLVMYVLVG
ncbi:hypothetical protein CDL12_00323 [Handroanthus impetiginosus]|uniref:Dirigent protein n=1 Tax=Handroanthus impetiginosus TaxID=429701 RepID=A0A2G9IAZ7_9LAMI|nr:hypothetical protein CDL12_00323 [Handroanthus impetiginosus]